MNLFKQIGVSFMLAAFIMSTSGILVFESSCSCSGQEEKSLFVTPKTCEENFHDHHHHNKEGEEIATEEDDCHECDNHLNECGCSKLIVKFFKLKNQITEEEEKFVKIESFKLLAVSIDVTETTKQQDNSYNEINYIEPPPKILSASDFLIQIQQLKLPART